MKAHDDYKRLETPDGLPHCPCCGAEVELWQFSEAETAPTTKVVMCSNGVQFGPQDGLVGEGCPLYMPNQLHYRATIRDAVKYWREFAEALESQRAERDKQRRAA